MLVYTKIFSYHVTLSEIFLEPFTRLFETWIIYNRSILLRFDIFQCSIIIIKEIILERTSHRSFRVFHFAIMNFFLTNAIPYREIYRTKAK